LAITTHCSPRDQRKKLAKRTKKKHLSSRCGGIDVAQEDLRDDYPSIFFYFPTERLEVMAAEKCCLLKFGDKFIDSANAGLMAIWQRLSYEYVAPLFAESLYLRRFTGRGIEPHRVAGR
jgi:hypothetical protein